MQPPQDEGGYPALSFQARQFLKPETSETIKPPLITDIFALDAMTEMLSTPLHFLNYLQLRAKFGDKMLFSHEFTSLSFHLKYNLWLSEKYDMVMLEDDFAADLDVAMLARREGIVGSKTPDGILTQQQRSTLGRIVSEIETDPDPAKMDLGLSLLTLSGETTKNASGAIDSIVKLSARDQRNHDVTFAFDSREAGLTVHCNSDPPKVAAAAIQRHCVVRKYGAKAGQWFGLCIRPSDGGVRFGVELEYPWEHNSELDRVVKDMPPSQKLTEDLKIRGAAKRKPGRNDPCRCGSGLKYKKCCLSKTRI